MAMAASAAVVNLSGLQASAYAAATPQAQKQTVAGQWTVSPAVPVGADSRFLGTDTVAPNNGWAVGGTNAFSQDILGKTLIEHWDGTKWAGTPSPNPGFGANFPTGSDVLSAVDATSSTDAWAAGDIGLGPFQGAATLIEHWNGSTWSVVPSPNHVQPSLDFYNILSDVSATSPTSAYAAGWDGDNFGEGNPNDFGDDAFPLAEHWDGSKWTELPRPTVGNGAKFVKLTAVQAFGPNDAMFVGEFADHVDSPIRHPFAVRWNGTSWNTVAIPDVPLSTTANRVLLRDIKGSATDAWAVGQVLYTDAQGNPRSQAVTEHWNGTKWSLVTNPTPNPDPGTTLTGVAPFASNDVWATGTSGIGSDQPLTEHWDGTSWKIVPGPASDKGYNCGLFGAAAAPGGAQTVGACIAVDTNTQPHVKPFVELFR
jgi:hypothetical protein